MTPKRKKENYHIWQINYGTNDDGTLTSFEGGLVQYARKWKVQYYKYNIINTILHIIKPLVHQA